MPPNVLSRLVAGYPYAYAAGRFVQEGFVGEMGVQSTAPLSPTWSIISRPPASKLNPTATPCPQGSATPFWMEPVTSPTDRFTQTITVVVGDGEAVTVTAESGSFDTEMDGSKDSALVDITLLPGVTHHLTVRDRRRQRILFGDCKYSEGIRTTTIDRYGNLLEIVQTRRRSYLPVIVR